MRTIEVVTFDVTGTLIHCPRLFEIYAEVLDRHGVDVEPDDLREPFRLTWQELDCSTPTGLDRYCQHPEGSRGWWRRFLERLCELLEAKAPSKFTAAELYARFAHADAWETYEEVPAVLEDLLERGYRLAVLSNWDERLPELLHRMRLADYFEEIVYSASLGIAKPNPEIFRHTLDRLRVRPGEALHIGDSAQEDVEGAIAAGMRAVLLERQGHREGAPDLDAAVRQLETLGHQPGLRRLV